MNTLKRLAFIFLFAIVNGQVYASIQIENALGIVNKTEEIVEFSGLVGGYTSINPVIGLNQKTRLLFDPGATLLRGHIMIYSPKIPGHYIDNIVFSYRKMNGVSQLTADDLYNKVALKTSKQYLVVS